MNGFNITVRSHLTLKFTKHDKSHQNDHSPKWSYMQAIGFKLPLATYLVLPEAKLPGSLRRGAYPGDGAPTGKFRSEPLALAGNCSARRGLRVRPEAGEEEAWRKFASIVVPCTTSMWHFCS